MVVSGVALAGCTSDLNAPSNYAIPSEPGSSDDGEPEALEVDCGDVPVTAVQAAFEHAPTVAGGDGSYAFTLSGAPDGIVIDEGSGVISGAATVEGAFTLTIDVTDGTLTGSTTCDLTVNPRLTVDLSTDPPGCLSGNQSLIDSITSGTGDGTPIVCDFPDGRGDGTLPAGISVGAESCRLEGELQETRFGTWVMFMRGAQSGVEVFVPYCVTQDDPGDGFLINVAHSGVDNNTLVPMVGTFNPDSTYAIGEDGDPHFTIVDPETCGGECSNYGFTYGVSVGNFDAVNVMDLVTGNGLLLDEDGERIGMQHGLVRLQGGPVDDEFRDRAWAMTLALEYCLAANDADCDGKANINENANGHFQFSVLMFPDPG